MSGNTVFLDRRSFLRGAATLLSQIKSSPSLVGAAFSKTEISEKLPPVPFTSEIFKTNFYRFLSNYIDELGSLQNPSKEIDDLKLEQFLSLSSYINCISYFLYLANCKDTESLFEEIPPNLRENAKVVNVDLSVFENKDQIPGHISSITEKYWLCHRDFIGRLKKDGRSVLPLFQNSRPDMQWGSCCGLQLPAMDFLGTKDIFDFEKEDLFFLTEINFLLRHRFSARYFELKPQQWAFLNMIENHPLNKIQQFTRYFCSYGTIQDVFNGTAKADMSLAALDPAFDTLREHLNENLSCFETESNFTIPLSYDFIERTSTMSIEEAAQALIEYDKTFLENYKKDLWDSISFVRMRSAEKPSQSLEPVTSEAGLIDRYAVMSKMNFNHYCYGCREDIAFTLKEFFSEAVVISDEKAKEISVRWSCTNGDLRLIDQKTVSPDFAL